MRGLAVVLLGIGILTAGGIALVGATGGLWPHPRELSSSGPPVMVLIHDDGRLMISEGGHPPRLTSTAALPADLRRALGARATSHRIFLRANGAVGYTQFMAVINALQHAGFEKIGLTNEGVRDGG